MVCAKNFFGGARAKSFFTPFAGSDQFCSVFISPVYFTLKLFGSGRIGQDRKVQFSKQLFRVFKTQMLHVHSRDPRLFAKMGHPKMTPFWTLFSRIDRIGKFWNSFRGK